MGPDESTPAIAMMMIVAEKSSVRTVVFVTVWDSPSFVFLSNLSQPPARAVKNTDSDDNLITKFIGKCARNDIRCVSSPVPSPPN